MSRFWSAPVKALQPYVAGEQPSHPDLLKLNTNESPFPPSPGVVSALTGFDAASLRLYPDPDSCSLRDTIAQYHGLSRENIFVGNGSDEVLAHAFYAFFKQDLPLQFPDITYSFYPVYCRFFDIEAELIPLAGDFSVELDDYGRECGGVIFANPNAPTGKLMSLAAIEQFLQHFTDRVLIVDEAYIDFAGDSGDASSYSAAMLIERYPNLLVVRTLSKSRSLAGLRLGYAMGSSELIEGLARVKDSFNSYPVDQLASALAEASFADEEYFQSTVAAIVEQRRALVTALSDLGVECLPSAANFLFARFDKLPAQQVFEQLKKRGVYVRFFDKPRLRDYLRITVGDAKGNQRFLSELADILAASAI